MRKKGDGVDETITGHWLYGFRRSASTAPDRRCHFTYCAGKRALLRRSCCGSSSWSMGTTVDGATRQRGGQSGQWGARWDRAALCLQPWHEQDPSAPSFPNRPQVWPVTWKDAECTLSVIHLATRSVLDTLGSRAITRAHRAFFQRIRRSLASRSDRVDRADRSFLHYTLPP